MEKALVIGVVIIILTGTGIFATGTNVNIEREEEVKIKEIGETITEEYTFSYPTFGEYMGYSCVYVEEANHYDIHDGWPVLPVKTKTYEFPLGTKILDVSICHPEPETICLDKKISVGSCSILTAENASVYNESDMFPSSFVSYYCGGGISDGSRKTILTVRVNPITYRPADYELEFIDESTVTIEYKLPEESLLDEICNYELLIITISDFEQLLQRFVAHKENMGVKTKLVTLDEISETTGRDIQEKMKYYIKGAIESWGIKYVLLIGGIKGTTEEWNLPARYSHILISRGKQEIPEPEFLSDLYFADIYDSEGNFSSWDTNENDIFGEWYGDNQVDEMDLYPDVYIGRLPCRNKRELRIARDKIIRYERWKAAERWFKKIILIAGDHWRDPNNIAEGILVMDEAADIMTGFKPVKIYATEDNTVLVRHINWAIDRGAGFLYVSGHGSPYSWGAKYPPNCEGVAPTLTRLRKTNWYISIYMNFLINGRKLPITVVGGCNNGQFDMPSTNKLITFNCWAWKLVTHRWGGGIATIANTGLGTHAMNDADNNGVNDYLEVLDGFLELRFFELYNQENVEILGEMHGGALRDYLNTFIISHDEMDPKMVSQWQLLGDPSLKVGGYS